MTYESKITHNDTHLCGWRGSPQRGWGPQIWPVLTELENLDIGYVGFNKEDARLCWQPHEPLHAIFELTQLTSLSVNCVPWSTLPEQLTQLQSLRSLELYYWNLIPFNGQCDLIGQLPHLGNLLIYGCFRSISLPFVRLTNLVSLTLENSEVTCDDLKTINLACSLSELVLEDCNCIHEMPLAFEKLLKLTRFSAVRMEHTLLLPRLDRFPATVSVPSYELLPKKYHKPYWRDAGWGNSKHYGARIGCELRLYCRAIFLEARSILIDFVLAFSGLHLPSYVLYDIVCVLPDSYWLSESRLRDYGDKLSESRFRDYDDKRLPGIRHTRAEVVKLIASINETVYRRRLMSVKL
jgi:hypothetical protein